MTDGPSYAPCANLSRPTTPGHVPSVQARPSTTATAQSYGASASDVGDAPAADTVPDYGRQTGGPRPMATDYVGRLTSRSFAALCRAAASRISRPTRAAAFACGIDSDIAPRLAASISAGVQAVLSILTPAWRSRRTRSRYMQARAGDSRFVVEGSTTSRRAWRATRSRRWSSMRKRDIESVRRDSPGLEPEESERPRRDFSETELFDGEPVGVYTMDMEIDGTDVDINVLDARGSFAKAEAVSEPAFAAEAIAEFEFEAEADLDAESLAPFAETRVAGHHGSDASIAGESRVRPCVRRRRGRRRHRSPRQSTPNLSKTSYTE